VTWTAYKRAIETYSFLFFALYFKGLDCGLAIKCYCFHCLCVDVLIVLCRLLLLVYCLLVYYSPPKSGGPPPARWRPAASAPCTLQRKHEHGRGTHLRRRVAAAAGQMLQQLASDRAQAVPEILTNFP